MSEHYPRPSILEAIPRNRHAVIEASAGTGKTFTIEHLVVELLLSEDVSLEQILVLTFTERAAEELRQRIRSKIEQVLFDPCRKQDCDHEKTWGVWWIDENARGKLSNALFAFDAASIGTIHGFFRRVLTEHAFHSGRLFEGTLEDGRTLFDRAFKTTLRRSLAVRPGDAAPLLAMWLEQRRAEGSVAELENLLYRCYTARGKILPAVTLPALRHEIDTNTLFRVDLRAEAGRFRTALADAKVHHSTVRAIVNRLLELSDRIGRSGRAEVTLLDRDFQRIVHEIAERIRDRALPDTRAAELAQAILRLESKPPSLEAALVQVGLPIALEVLKRHKTVTGQFDFDDLIKGVADALEGPSGKELVAALRRRYRFALIDEFQDTDELQWLFFHKVFVESDGPQRAYLIGDPKQAIYGFRGADVQAYISARNELERAGSPRVPLKDNFRSTPALIDAYNLVFDRSAQQPFFEGDIEYDEPVRAGRDFVAEEAHAQSAPIHLLKIEPRGEELKLPELRRGLARQIAREARKLLFDGPGLHFGPRGAAERIQPRDVYILTAKNSEATQIGLALRDVGVPFSFYKQDGLFRTNEALQVRDLLAAVEEPDDPARRGRAWLTPFFDVPLEALPELADLGDADPLLKRLRDWNELAGRRQFESLFSRILDESGVIRRELFLKDDERAITNYLHLFEILLEEARATGRELADLVATLTAYIQGTRKPPGEDGDVQRLESDRDAVQIMTIHKSKGLEAAVVFVYGGFTAFPPDGTYSYHDEQGRAFYIGKNDLVEDLANKERDQEQQRLFYVALTRAKARLYLPIVPHQLWKDKWNGGYKRVNDRLNELESVLKPAQFERHFRVITFKERPPGRRAGDEDQPACDLTALRPPDELRSERDGAREFGALRDRHAGYEVTSYSRMKRTWDVELVPLGQEELDYEPVRAAPDASLSEGALPGGTAAGTLVHEILELVPFESPREAGDFPSWLELKPVAEVIETALANNGFDRAYLGAAAEMAYLALTRPVPIANGESIPGLCRCAKHLREMEFLFPHPGIHDPPLSEIAPRKLMIERGFIKGFVDLVVQHAGLVYFADWKSDVLDSYEPEALGEHVQLHYSLQAKLYALAMVKALDAHSEPDYEARFGGLVYVFLRGLKLASPDKPAVYSERPSWADILRYEQEVKEFGTRTRGARA